MVQLLGVGRRHPSRHRLDALALAGQDQPLEVERCPVSLRLAPQPRQERCQPALKLTLPAFHRQATHCAPPLRDPCSRNIRTARTWQSSGRTLDPTLVHLVEERKHILYLLRIVLSAIALNVLFLRRRWRSLEQLITVQPARLDCRMMAHHLLRPLARMTEI